MRKRGHPGAPNVPYETSTRDAKRAIACETGSPAPIVNVIASFGLASTHRPQPRHASPMVAQPSTRRMASTKQIPAAHVPQPAHRSVTVTLMPGMRVTLAPMAGSSCGCFVLDLRGWPRRYHDRDRRPDLMCSMEPVRAATSQSRCAPRSWRRSRRLEGSLSLPPVGRAVSLGAQLQTGAIRTIARTIGLVQDLNRKTHEPNSCVLVGVVSAGTTGVSHECGIW